MSGLSRSKVEEGIWLVLLIEQWLLKLYHIISTFSTISAECIVFYNFLFIYFYYLPDLINQRRRFKVSWEYLYVYIIKSIQTSCRPYVFKICGRMEQFKNMRKDERWATVLMNVTDWSTKWDGYLDEIFVAFYLETKLYLLWQFLWFIFISKKIPWNWPIYTYRFWLHTIYPVNHCQIFPHINFVMCKNLICY